MKAEDTVMDDEQLDACRQPGGLGLYDLREVARRQAELSFELGVEEGWKQAEAHYHIDTG